MALASEFPKRLQDLIREGRWGTTGSECDPRISASLARQWDPDAAGIHLISTPTTLQEDLDRVPELADLWNLEDVTPEKCVVIADFGLGSDNPIVVDLSADPAPVLAQRWEPTESEQRPSWIRIADTFDDFATMLGI